MIIIIKILLIITVVRHSASSQPRSLSNQQQEQEQQQQQQPPPPPPLQLKLQLQSLSELTRSHIQNIKCPEPLFPFYDRIINSQEEQEEGQKQQLIPKSIHFAWIRGYHFNDDDDSV
jgi:hypothetical protein